MKKRYLAISLIALLGACADYEDEVKDLRNHDFEVDDVNLPEEDPTDGTENTTSESTETEAKKTSSNSEWSYKVIVVSEGNWGYQLFQKDKMVINQTTIPSVQGMAGFSSEEKAERTAKHILNKVENGIFPPTVDKKELEELGVL